MKHKILIWCIPFLCSTISAQNGLEKKLGADGTIFYLGTTVIKIGEKEIKNPSYSTDDWKYWIFDGVFFRNNISDCVIDTMGNTNLLGYRDLDREDWAERGI